MSDEPMQRHNDEWSMLLKMRDKEIDALNEKLRVALAEIERLENKLEEFELGSRGFP